MTEFDDIIGFVTPEQTIKTVKFANRLGSKKIVIVFNKHSSKNAESLKELSKNTETDLLSCLMVKTQRDAQKYQDRYDYLLGNAERGMIEAKTVRLITSAETLIDKKDKTHYRLSGLNQVTAKIMNEKKKMYLFNLKMLLSSDEKELLLGRMKQNKRLLEKYEVDHFLMSFAEEKLDVRAGKERKLFLDQF